MSRTEYAVKNVLFGFVSKILLLLFSFISRTVFIYFLGNEYLGINGLYTQIISVLSFAELGFGTALNYMLYKPVAEGDSIKVVKLLAFYKNIYRIIATIVTIIGICLLPFLQYIVKGADSLTLFDLRLYYAFFLFNSVVSYFTTYKLSYVNALQKNYIQTKCDTVIHIVSLVLQTLIIILTHNFLAYLITQSFVLLISRFFLALYLNKNFPILKVKSEAVLSKEERKPIFEEVKGVILHRFAGIAVHSTDSIIISAISGAGVIAVGLISNYNIIIDGVKSFVVILFNSITAGFGNLVAVSTTENYRKTFLTANFINFWIYGFCAIAFFVLLPPFITLWLGAESLIDTWSFLLIIINTYMQGQMSIFINARDAKGNFGKDKWLAVLQALVNLIVSVVLAKKMGLVGVYIGTFVSNLVFLIFRPLFTYKFLFKRSCKEYFMRFIGYSLSVLMAGVITYVVAKFILAEITVIRFIITAIAVVIIPNALFLILFFNTREFKNMTLKAKSVLSSMQGGKFIMIRKIKNIIYKLYQRIMYVLSLLYLVLSGKQKKYNNYLKSIKDKYKGQRCFVIGNGPSLTKEDLDKLSCEITFASNRIYKIFSETDWRPTYYMMFDEGVAASDGVIDGVNSFECEMKFFRQQGYYVCRKVKSPSCFIHSWWSRKSLDNPQFSEDLSKGIYAIATVTYTMIELARHMGFSEIYLIGVDHKYANERKKDGTIVKNEGVKTYFGNHGKKASQSIAASWEMEIAYNYAEKYSRENGFRIYNATRGGYLEAFERVDLDEVLDVMEDK